MIVVEGKVMPDLNILSVCMKYVHPVFSTGDPLQAHRHVGSESADSEGTR